MRNMGKKREKRLPPIEFDGYKNPQSRIKNDSEIPVQIFVHGNPSFVIRTLVPGQAASLSLFN
jgi:hypothetical protein